MAKLPSQCSVVSFSPDYDSFTLDKKGVLRGRAGAVHVGVDVRSRGFVLAETPGAIREEP